MNRRLRRYQALDERVKRLGMRIQQLSEALPRATRMGLTDLADRIAQRKAEVSDLWNTLFDQLCRIEAELAKEGKLQF
jgi:hypothetical protein